MVITAGYRIRFVDHLISEAYYISMPTVFCRKCRASFYTKPYWQKLGYGIYCSKTCQYQARKQGKMKCCFVCKKAVYKSPKDLKRSKSQRFFCSKSCQAVWRNNLYHGSKHPNWKEGKYVGYRNIILKTKKSQICELCGCTDERVLCVHHVDQNRKNNQVTNLVWLCYNCHHLAHRHGVKF